MGPDNKSTHFGYREVAVEEKSGLVAEVFRSVAPKYDLMNDFMSFGLHRLWKRFVLQQANLREGLCVLDVASGTGDLALGIAKAVGKRGKVVMSDINDAMLNIGRDKLIDAGMLGNIECVQADAENLPFKNGMFDRVMIAFGLRNVTNKLEAMRDMYRVLAPGGKLLVLEFSHPESELLSKIYDVYSFNVIPKLGEVVANDRDSYQYLVESIRMHPKQAMLKQMMLESGLEDVDYFNLCGGVVALHQGYKY